MTATPRDHLGALAEKYRTLVALREAHERTGEVASPEALRALAERFPGALRELDALSREELDGRREALDAALARVEGAAPDWALWMIDWHSVMAAALAVKRALGAGEGPGDGALLALARSLSTAPLGDGFVAAVRRPPRGRLSVLVAELVAGHHGVTTAALWAVLFPRPSRVA